jgi:hypothetical protein
MELTPLIGLSSLWIDKRNLVSPEVDRRRALVVLQKIDEVLSWQHKTDDERDERFVELGKHLCEVRSGRYWKVENLCSFDEFLEKRFPGSRRKAYYLMAIHEQLPKQIHRDLTKVGWSKAIDLAKVARKDGEDFDSATWLHEAKRLSKEDFKLAVERHLTGQEVEPWEIVYFKIFRSQIPIIEQALETASLMLGSQKSRGYCFEMICADFLAGASLDDPNSTSLFDSVRRLLELLPTSRKTELIEGFQRPR